MGVRALLKRIERTEKVFKAQSIFSPDGICFMEKEQPCVCSAFALYRSQTAVNRAIQTCTEGSNPTLSATQSEVQRKSSSFPPKYAENARISRLLQDKPDWREWTAWPEAGHYLSFSPEGTCAVRF